MALPTTRPRFEPPQSYIRRSFDFRITTNYNCKHETLRLKLNPKPFRAPEPSKEPSFQLRTRGWALPCNKKSLGFSMQGCGVPGLGFRVPGLGVGLGFWGAGFRV